MDGNEQTGVSIAEVTDKLDAGDIFLQKTVPITPEEDAAQLTARLADLSYHVLSELFSRIEKNAVTRIPQDDSQSSYARKLIKEDGWIHWSEPGKKIVDRIRGLVPWPAACTQCGDAALQVLKARYVDGTGNSEPGTIVEIHKDGSLRVNAGQGFVDIECVKPEGRQAMSARDFANGRHLKAGDRLGRA